MVKNAPKPTRRSFLKYGIATAGLVIATTIGTQLIERNPKSRGLVGLTFQNSVLNPDIRQDYLNKLFENRHQEQDEAWLSIAEFVYDPGLNKIRRHGEIRPCVYGSDTNGIELIITPDGPDLRGKPVPIYFTEHAFSSGIVVSEDELKSMIDHESAHALMVHRSQVQFPMPPEGQQIGRLPPEIQGKLFESLAFEKQIVLYAGLKKRTVGDAFDRDIFETYRYINHELEQYAASNPEHGKIIYPILRALRVQPKKQ